MKREREIKESAAMYFSDGDEITIGQLEFLTWHKSRGYDVVFELGEYGLKISIEKEVKND